MLFWMVMSKKYGKHLFVSDDASIPKGNRMLVTTAIIFNNIFARIDACFKADEIGCSEKCFEEHGIDGLIWDDIEKDCFNVLYVRCEQALSKFPDQEWLDYEKLDPEVRRGWTTIVWEWREILEMMKLDKKYKSIGILGARTGAGPQIFAADEAVKATNTEIISAEMPRDTEGGCGHGCLIIFGAEDVSDVRRAVEVTLANVETYFGDVWGNEVGYLELQYTARASYCLNKALGAPVGKAFGLVLGAPAGIGVVISDTALKAAEVEAFAYCSPAKGTSFTNESFIMITGDSGAVRQAIRSAREVGVKLLATLGSEPKSGSVSYI